MPAKLLIYTQTSPASSRWSRLKGGLQCVLREGGQFDNDRDRKNVGWGGKATGGEEGDSKEMKVSGRGCPEAEAPQPHLRLLKTKRKNPDTFLSLKSLDLWKSIDNIPM